MKLYTALVWLGMLSSARPCLALSGSKFRFKLNQLYEVGIGLEGLRGTPAAFGDFNSNQHSDLFVISPDQTTIQLWVWENDLKQFAHLDSADITVPGVILSNVIVGDFNMDGKLDVIVQGQSKGNDEVVMRCYLGDGVSGFSDGGQLPSANGALPFAFDWSGSGRVDLLGAAWDQKDDSDSGVRVWLHVDADASSKPLAAKTTASSNVVGTRDSTLVKRDDVELFQLREFGVGNLTVAMCRPASPHSSAFVDLNGDCLPDLFLVCHGNEEYQIWTNSKTGFEYSQTGKLPSNAGPVSFADMNSDGSMDMVIPIVGKSQIYIVYNEQRPLCVGSRKQEGCRKFSRICEADDAFSFSLKDAQVVDIENMWPGETLSDSLADFQASVTVPPAVRLTDVDLDGYPDMAFVTHKGKDESHVRMLRSELCPDCKISGSAQLDYRSFVAIKEGVSVLETLGRPQDVAFFDIDGSGTADLLVHYLDSAGSRRVSAIYNNFFTDAFFIKALACPTNEKHVRSYSGFLPGATFKYLVVSDSGEKHVAQSVQAPQSAYRALFTPYTIIGIGRTNNYIEDFSVGSSSQLGVHERSFEGLIPNSQVIVFPVNTTSEWRLELYMNRSESTPYILATLLSSMGLLAITVFALGAMERKADQREKQRALHSINFDAL